MRLVLDVNKSEVPCVLRGKGRITHGPEITSFSRTLTELIPETQHLAIDLCAVELIDSVGLGELVVALMWAQANGCTTKLAVSSRVRELLELTNLLSVFETFTSIDEVLASFEQSSPKPQVAKSQAA